MDPTEAKLRTELAELDRQLAASTEFGTPEMIKLAKRQAELASLVGLYDRRAKLTKEIAEHEAIIKQDPELAELASVELPLLQADLASAEDELHLALVPKDPADDKAAIMEIRAGAGGDEASLFAGELYRLYARYVETKPGWRLELLSESPSDVGGYKEIIFEIKGDHAYGTLKYESGVHRVQRVPETESQGRVHTSTVTVAVLPEAEETDLVINDADLRIDVYRSSGHGGQSVNTTDSAVRITHLPTGLVVAIQNERSQLQNREKALTVLKSRLTTLMEAQSKAEITELRASDKSAEWGQQIRNYVLHPYTKVKDVRTGAETNDAQSVLDGELQPFIEAYLQSQISASRE